LRDFEGRSALLLGKAKDNNGSCAIGPFIRLFDSTYTLEDLRKCDLTLKIQGTDGFSVSAVSSMSKISRDVTELVAQTVNETHQYPGNKLHSFYITFYRRICIIYRHHVCPYDGP
jgi:fumarylacetoacetate (FAA) hydrolase family protein